MHGEIERVEISGGWSQPEFKHWWKLYVDGSIVDLYFINDEPRAVVAAGRVFSVDPTKHNESIRFDGGEIYHVISKEAV